MRLVMAQMAMTDNIDENADRALAYYDQAGEAGAALVLQLFDLSDVEDAAFLRLVVKVQRGGHGSAAFRIHDCDAHAIIAGIPKV